MIHYLVRRDHAYTIRRQAPGQWLKSLYPFFKPVSYERLFRERSAMPGVYIFSDIERLSPGEAEKAGEIHRRLSEAGNCRILNHPIRSMRRFELLRTLHERGVNDFNVFRLTEKPGRFPVFIRDENRHGCFFSPAVSSPEELAKILRDMEARGLSRRNKIITEFCDTRSPDGIYRKYGAFYIAGSVIPRHVYFARDWMVRLVSADAFDARTLAEEREYLMTNPHAEVIKEIFRVARIDYGRVDYGLSGGRPQVWEINTNPMLFSTREPVAARLEYKALFAERFEKAMRELGDAGAPKSPAIRLRKNTPVALIFKSWGRNARDFLLSLLPGGVEDRIRLVFSWRLRG